MRVDGACHCGAITFRAEADPARAAICHCSDCQAMSGSAFRTVLQAPESGFELLSGTPRTYVKTTAASGNHREMAFCERCGTQLWATSVEPPGDRLFGIRIGTLVQRAELAPQVQVWSGSRLAWLDELADLPALEGQ